jgi:hypothetical protein
MALLTVRRPSPGRRELLLQGKWVPVGTDIDTSEFPRVSRIPGKWAQLVRLGILEDRHFADPDLVREVDSQREQFGSAPLVETRMDPGIPVPLDAEDIARLEKPTVLQCGDCGFHATSQQGLKVHVSRKHTKE